MDIKTGDYILITDCNDENYLKIGEVLETDCYPDGKKKSFGVAFGEISEYGALMIHTYKAMDLENYKCKVLQFANR